MWIKIFVFLIIFVGVNGAKDCFINMEDIKDEEKCATLSWSILPVQGPADEYLIVKTGTVLISTCNSNVYRYKYHCKSNGKWDKEPLQKSCKDVKKTCSVPSKQWKNWKWKCDNLVFKGSKCTGTCESNMDLKMNIECSQNGEWKFNGDLNPDDCNDACVQGKWFQIEGKKFCFVSQCLNYKEAGEFCNNIYGFLFEPKTEESNLKVYKKAMEVFKKEGNDCENVWLGMNDKLHENEFVYSSDDAPLESFLHWNPEEPNNVILPNDESNEGEDCVEYRIRVVDFVAGWNDYICNGVNKFICEK